MSKPALLTLDTRDDRVELWHLLHRLPPKERVRFVGWAADRAAPVTGNRPVPRYDRELIDLAYRCDAADLRVTNAAFADVWMLVGQWKLDPVVMAVELEDRVKRPHSSARPSRPS